MKPEDLFGAVRGNASLSLDQEEWEDLSALLNQYPADRVKRMAQRWFGKAAKTRKQDCIDQMAGALGDATALREIHERLSPFEKSGLWMLIQRGGALPVLEIAADLLAAGHEFQDVGNYFSNYSFGYGASEYFKVASSLADTGLLITASVDSWGNTLDPSAFARQTAVIGVTTYARLVPHLKPVAPRPLELAPLTKPVEGEFLRPAQAAMPLGAVTEFLRGAETITLTARGGFPRPFVNRAAKRLGVEASRDTSAPLPDPALFYLQLAVSANFLSFPVQERTTSLAPLAEQLMAQPYEVQATYWLNGYRSLKGWAEPLPELVHFYDDNLHQASKFNAFRNLVVTALSALPQPEAWYAAAAFSDALHARAQGFLHLTYRREFYPNYRMTPAQQREARRVHNQQLLAEWRRIEQVLLENILRGPLYHLGIVEIATTAGGGLAFRLTDLGRAVLLGIPMPAASEEAGAAAGSWVVQPNLEVVAYLDRTPPAGLALLARVAERKSSTGPVAVYTITRESIYAALESGHHADEIIDALRAGAANELPDTVVRSIRDWSARRERIQLFPSATLLQYADTAARDAALHDLARSSIAVGDRFILLPEGDLQGVHGRKTAQRIDYGAAPFRCVTVEEEGTLRIDPRRSDLLIASELSAFADAVPDAEGTWTLTRTSVQRAVSAGHTADAILKALGVRAVSSVPPILHAAVPRWARKIGQAAPARLETVFVLELPSEEIANAVAASRRFQPFLRSRLGPRAFSVALKDEDQIRRLLIEYALEPRSP